RPTRRARNGKPTVSSRSIASVEVSGRAVPLAPPVAAASLPPDPLPPDVPAPPAVPTPTPPPPAPALGAPEPVPARSSVEKRPRVEERPRTVPSESGAAGAVPDAVSEAVSAAESAVEPASVSPRARALATPSDRPPTNEVAPLPSVGVAPRRGRRCAERQGGIGIGVTTGRRPRRTERHRSGAVGLAALGGGC